MNFKNGRWSIININVDKSGEFIFKSELEASQAKGVKNYFSRSRIEMKEALETTFQLKNARYYIVGSDDFLSSTAGFLLKNDIEKQQIYFDKHKSEINKIFKNS